MLPLFLVAMVEVSADAPLHVAAAQPAQALVRIVRGVELRFDRLQPTDDSVLRTSKVLDTDGSIRSAKLVEFY
jgi:hypothetical protein